MFLIHLLFLLFFEIGDKVIPLWVMYLFLTGTGLVGGLLGLWRFWAGLVWLLVPMAFFLFLIVPLQLGEIEYFYDQMIRELGYGYIVNSYLAPILGLALNLGGIVFGFIWRSRKQKFR